MTPPLAVAPTRRHAKGTFMYADGSQHTGQWENNKKHGPAVFISDGGRTFEGRFENDVMVGKMGQVTATCDRPLSKARVSCVLYIRAGSLFLDIFGWWVGPRAGAAQSRVDNKTTAQTSERSVKPPTSSAPSPEACLESSVCDSVFRHYTPCCVDQASGRNC